MQLSIVSTLYQSDLHLREFVARASAAANRCCGSDYEVILVNDGSPDGSLQTAIELSATDQHIVVLDLSRNFGHVQAMIAGLRQAKGQRVFLLDSDLEEDPAWLLDFSKDMDSSDSDLVYGVQAQRKGDLFERVSGALFYRFFNFVTGWDMPRNVVTARLMTRRFVDAFLQHEERVVSFSGLMWLTGFRQVAHPVIKLDTSPSTFTLKRKIQLVVDAVTAFSSKPLEMIFYTGFSIFALASCYGVYLVIIQLFFSKRLEGWTSVMASIWILGGLIISFLGIIGIYLANAFMELKRRPTSIVRAVHTADRPHGLPDKEAP